MKTVYKLEPNTQIAALLETHGYKDTQALADNLSVNIRDVELALNDDFMLSIIEDFPHFKIRLAICNLLDIPFTIPE